MRLWWAALVVRTLPAAPEGKDDEIWVFEDDVPRPAGLFDEAGVTLLTRPVARGRRQPLLTAERRAWRRIATHSARSRDDGVPTGSVHSFA